MKNFISLKTWKIDKGRYLHQIGVKEGWFRVVSDSFYYSLTESYEVVFSNKVSTKWDNKETVGLKLVWEGCKELSDFGWSKLCYGGTDNIELRKKIHGKGLRLIELKVWVYSTGQVERIVNKTNNTSIIPPSRYVWLGRDLNKRIKNPLPYMYFKIIGAGCDEKLKVLYFKVPEPDYVQFYLKLIGNDCKNF